MNQPSSDSRLQALAATVSNLATQQALEAIRPNLQPLGSDNIHVHFGKRESHHQSEQSYAIAQPSQVAGRTVLIRAPQGHIKVEGSSVLGEQQTALLADRVSIISAEDHQQQQDSQQEKTTGFSASTEGSALRIGGQSQSVQQQQSDILHQGSHVACAQGNLIIQAPQGYRQRASQVVAPQGQLEIHSTKVDILAGINQRQLTQKTSSSSSGLTMGLDNPLAKTLEAAVSQSDNPRLQALALATGGWASKNVLEALQYDPQQLALMKGNASFGNRETHHGRSESYTTAQPSHVFGRTTLISAPQGHIQVEGSSVESEQRTTLLADSVSVTSAELPQQQRCFQSEEKNGLFPSGPLSTTFGEQESSSQQQRHCTQQQSSIIGSQRGDVHIWAKQHYQQQGSHLLTPQGDGIVSAATLDILDTHNQQQFTQESSSSIDGLTAGVTNPIASAIQNAQQLQAAARQSDNPRLQALAIATGGLAVKNLADALKANPQQLGGLDFSITVGSRESQSNSQQSHSTAHRSQLVARNIILQAREGDATIQGDVQAAEQAQITAAGQLKFLASENRGQQQGSQSSSSVSMGIGFGSSGPPAIIVGVSDGDGSGQGASCRYNLAQVNAGQKVVLQSGSDTLIQGVIKAPQVQNKVGGNLTIESLQDTDTQRGEQQQFGMEVAIGFKRFSASANVVQSHYDSDFASVQQQAGIKAGDLGFQNEVDGITQIRGGVIASSSKAVKEDRNRHSTAAILYTNLENRADYEAQSFGGSIGFSKESGQSALPAGGEGAVAQGASSRAGAIPIALNASDSASSTTYSGISGAGKAVTITNPAAQLALTGQTPEQAIAGIDASITSDKDGSNTLAPIFNREEIEAGFQIVGTLTREVGTFLDNRSKEQTQAQTDLKEEQAKAPALQDSQKIAQLQQTLQENQKWAMGCTGRLLMTALTLAAGSNISGTTGQLLQATAVNTLQGLGAQQIKLIADSMNSEAARTGLQGLLAGAGAAAQGQNATPAVLGASASVVLNNLIRECLWRAQPSTHRRGAPSP